MDLKTTTRPRRHAAAFKAVRALIETMARARPAEVMEVGPGLAVRFLGRLAEEGRFGWDLFKRIETGIRRIPMPDACYESYETRDLLGALDGLAIRLTVLDVNPRVVRVVGSKHRGAPVETILADLGEARPAPLVALYGRFDLVVAQAVIGRIATDRRDDARENLRRLVRPGGILLATGDVEAADCVPMPGYQGLYRKVEA